MQLKIATRKSALALWQAEHVAGILKALPDVDDVELVPMSTRGDEILDRSLQKIGGKGLFIKELEVAMREERADLAVHSMKDVPAEMPAGFCLAAVLQRSNHRDALVTRERCKLDDLRHGAVVGSSSLRRQAQLRMLRPDIDVKPLRGNVNTRLAKLDSGDFDAIVLAATGLERLGLDHHISQQFSIDEMLPATAQGVLGIECLAARDDIRSLLTAINDDIAAITTTAERAVARKLQASCQSPVASFAESNGDRVDVTALVALPDGSRYIRKSASGEAADAERVGERVAAILLEHGARELLAAAEAMNER
ncbi:MAG: hydroxymethylbilane synthase [Woeseiaceae bacterium]|nr:hydroxymethylbilane synthase [Woeseiaceae bacterium]